MNGSEQFPTVPEPSLVLDGSMVPTPIGGNRNRNHAGNRQASVVYPIGRHDGTEGTMDRRYNQPPVLAERPSRDPRVVWQARISSDRGRLEVVCVIDLASETIVVPALSDHELRQLLATVPSDQPACEQQWVCGECGRANSRARAWCQWCSQHQTSARGVNL